MPEELLAEMESALLAKGQLVLIGPPGTSKTFIAQEFARYFVRGEPGRRAQGPAPGVVYMHANWTYEDFFVGVRPKLGVNGLQFERREGALLRWINQNPGIQSGESRSVVVLDELNRCDTAAVFGELLQLLERRGETVRLMNGESFVLPRELHVIGTMNSADRSVGRMDLALRRRFYLFDLLPRSDVLKAWLLSHEARNPIGFDATVLDQCNRVLQDQYSIPREQHVGHALFMSGPGDGHSGTPLTHERFRQIIEYSVLPYVRELVLERGRDPEPALASVRGIFAPWLAPASS
jgi:5-methylcytosine-specific restriction endonuclease McrBC GTP-binding regulatory subunit McrB